jgi:hypothetical protein
MKIQEKTLANNGVNDERIVRVIKSYENSVK